MRFELKEYQEVAVREVLQRLEVCRDAWQGRYKERNSFALTAVTGAGKTVIASTVIEALIHGSSEYDIEADPGAVVLWISKDPALNRQTRQRIIESADRIEVGDLVLLDAESFAGEKLEKGTVYFINPGKLRDNANFVKKSNNRSVTFWEILDNTIQDPSLTLYVVLDEAHEGMKKVRKDEAEERQSIVQKIINGNGTNQAVPIVWGISATPERFIKAMANATNRGSKPNVEIEVADVQASGLIKNTLVMDIPDEKGDFVTSLLRDATIEFVAQSDRWADYCQREGEDSVQPLLVVQIPNRESETDEDKTIATVLKVVRENFPDFTDDCVAHVLGDRDLIEMAEISIPRVKPEDIQSDTVIRVLIAKDAVSTGWDCPRAEVLVSMRTAREKQYITQLLGRMVRTPLARTTSDDRLNSASCYLPHFDRDTAKEVAEIIMGQKKPADGEPPLPPGPRVLFNPVDLTWNERIENHEHVLTMFTTLPSFQKPSATPKPIKRALDAAVAVGVDHFVPKANQLLMDEFFGVLDGARAQYSKDVQRIAAGILEAEIRRFTTRYEDSEAQESQLKRDADENTVTEALGSTRRAFTTSVVNKYLKREYEAAVANDPLNADLVSIDAQVAALSRITRNDEPVVLSQLESVAEKTVRGWLQQFHSDIALLPESRRDVYEDIRGQAREPEIAPTEVPSDLRVEGTQEDGTPLDRRPKHLLADEHGNWPLDPKLNAWERLVLDRELARDSVVAWYRNPPAASKHAIKVPYRQDGVWRSLQPDFIFFERNVEGAIVASIVDPHARTFSGGNALARLVGLAEFAEAYGDAFVRIDVLDEGSDKTLRSIDLKDPQVRSALLSAEADGRSATDLFDGPLARNY